MNNKTTFNLFSFALIMVVLSMLVVACSDKKMHNSKKHKKKVHEKIVEAEVIDTTPPPYKYINEILTHTDSFQIKKSYKVALILPFELDSFYANKALIGVSNIPKGVYPALDFYEGAMIALDSLKNSDLNLELNVVDFAAKVKRFDSVIIQKKLKQMDLLIGTLNANDAKVVAEFAKKNKINFVSPVSSSFVPEFNPYYLSLNPNATLQQLKLLQIVESKYGNNINTLVIRQDNSAEENVASTTISSVMKQFSNSHPVEMILPGRTAVDSIPKELDTARHNIIFVASNDLVFVNSVLKKLSAIATTYPATVLGLPAWINYENLKNAVGKNLEVLFANSYLINRSTTEYQKFHRNFTQAYHIRPSELAIRGYSTMLYCGKMLQQNGSRFNYFSKIPTNVLYGKLQLQPIVSKERKHKYIQYYGNQQLNIIQLTANGTQPYKVE